VLRSSRLRPRLALISALALAGCETFTPPPKSAAELLAKGDLSGALEAAAMGHADEAARARLARAVIDAIDPTITVSTALDDKLIERAGIYTLRKLDPAWSIVRVRAGVKTARFGRVETTIDVSSGDRGLLILTKAPKSLSLLTGERYPLDTKHSTLKTGDFPWPLHVLTAGVLTVLTAHFENTYTPPPIEKVRAAVPRALRLAAALKDRCDEAGVCEQLLVVRRPLHDDVPLSLDVFVNVKPESGPWISVRANVDVPQRGRLEERLARAATDLKLAALPDAHLAVGTQRPSQDRCDEEYELRIGRCATIEIAPWPTAEVSPLGLTLPPAPEKLGTLKTSLAARPWWSHDEVAPQVSTTALDEAAPVPESVEGGLVHCKRQALRAPGEDMDHVFALVKVGKETWSLGGGGFTLPLLSLEPKSKLSISYFDLDWLSGADHLATVVLRRKGPLLSGSVGKEADYKRTYAAVQCRIFDRSAVEAAFTKMWTLAVNDLDGGEQMPIIVHPENRDFGLSNTEIRRAQQHIAMAAGLVGWDDPRVQGLLGRWDAQEQRFWTGVRQSIEDLSKGTSGPVVLERPKEPEMTIHQVRALRGEEVKKRLVAMKLAKRYDPAWLSQAFGVEIELENLSPRTFYASGLGSGVQLVLDDGRALDLEVVRGDNLQPGGRGVITLAPKETPPPSSRASGPWRLVVRGFRQFAFIPAEPAPSSP